MWLQVINKIKVIHQGEDRIKVKVKYQIFTSLQILCSPYSLQSGGLHLTEMHSCRFKSLMPIRVNLTCAS